MLQQPIMWHKIHLLIFTWFGMPVPASWNIWLNVHSRGTRSYKQGEKKESGQDSSESTFLSSQKKTLSLSWPVHVSCDSTLPLSSLHILQHWYFLPSSVVTYMNTGGSHILFFSITSLFRLYFTSKGTLWIVTVHISVSSTLQKQELSYSSACVPPLSLTQSR